MTPQFQHPKLTDDAVGELPLSAARAELLEEIMATPTLDRLDPDTPRVRTPRRWTAMLVASAAALAVIAVPAYVLNRDEPQVVTPAAPVNQPDPNGKYAVLDAPGWEVEHVLDDTQGEITYVKDGQSLDIHWRPAEHHTGYVEDRDELGGDPKEGEPTLLGQAALRWHYSKKDHTTIGPVVDTHFFEVRGSGMDEATYDELLGQLRQVDEAGFAAAMPDEVVTPVNRDDVVAAMLVDIPVPEGWSANEADLPTFATRYQTGYPLTEAVTCAWMKVYSAGQANADQAAVDRATEAMAGSRSWDILVEMGASGDGGSMIHEVADAMAVGKPATEIKDWLDCDGGDGMSGQNL